MKVEEAINTLNNTLFESEPYRPLKPPVNWIIGNRGRMMKHINQIGAPHDTFKGVVSNFYASNFETFSTIIANLWVGCEMDASVGLRLLTEHAISLSYLRHNPKQLVEIFLDFGRMERVKKLTAYLERYKSAVEELGSDYIEKTIEDGKKAACRRKEFQKCFEKKRRQRLEKAREREVKIDIPRWRNDLWCGRPVRIQAQDVDKDHLYRTYSITSNAVHVNPFRLSSYTYIADKSLASMPGEMTLSVACLVLSDIIEDVVNVLDIPDVNIGELVDLIPSS
jgi:hypothetical protein